jgi:hypothetical protein
MKYLYLVILFAFVSCIKEEEPRSKFVDRELQLKIRSYEKKKAKRCHNEMMEEITIEVDSIMYFLVAKMNGETDVMPSRPSRPKRLVDTITLESLEKK